LGPIPNPQSPIPNPHKLYFYSIIIKLHYYVGDWGLGIGDWAQSPIPNPQSPYYNITIK